MKQTSMTDTHASSDQRIAQLEREIADLTESLAQAWDQLVPFLQETPAEAKTTQDILPLLESIMAACEVQMSAVLLGHDEWFAYPQDFPLPSDLREALAALPSDCNTLVLHDVLIWGRVHTCWLFAPMRIEGRVVGAIGVGREDARHEFTALEARLLERMAERATHQLVAASLASSREREAQAARELHIASLIQRSILPVDQPRIAGLQFGADWQPAREVGGDAWGWLTLPDGRLAGFLLDVAGKGLPAALAAVSLHTAIKMALRLSSSPVQALRTVNEDFYDLCVRVDLLATVTVFTLDPCTGFYEQANAGHPPTLIRKGGEWQRFGATAPPLGVLPELNVEAQIEHLSDGDLVLCYSDGYSELETTDGLWGEAGIVEAVPSQPADSQAVIDALRRAARQAQAAPDMQDDQTLVAIRINRETN